MSRNGDLERNASPGNLVRQRCTVPDGVKVEETATFEEKDLLDMFEEEHCAGDDTLPGFAGKITAVTSRLSVSVCWVTIAGD